MATALRRTADEEIGLNLDWLNRAQLLGAWDHFYPDSAFDPAVSPHYVNLPHLLNLTEDEARAVQAPSDQGLQHQEWTWLSLAQASTDERVHGYVRMVMPRLAVA
jgi:colanic acid biosynthesis protein WcaH